MIKTKINDFKNKISIYMDIIKLYGQDSSSETQYGSSGTQD